MMKIIRFFLIMVAIIMFFGCNKGDEGNDIGGNNNDTSSSILSTSGKRIAGIVVNNIENAFYYDSSNRIIEVYYYFSTLKTEKITYSKDKIVLQSDNDNTVINLNSNGNLITSIGPDGPYCKYNEDGYLVSYGNTNYTWEDGNLVKIVDESESVKSVYTLEYDKNLNWPKNLFINAHIYKFSGILLPLGCWGKTPKNLHTKVHYEHISKDKANSTYTYDYTFKYSFEDGYPVKVDVTGGGHKSEFIIIWE